MPGPVIFDLDRTLVDVASFTDYDSAWARVSERFPDLVPDEGPETGWSSAARRCKTALATLPAGDTWTQVSQVLDQYERAGAGRCVPMPGAPQLVPALAPRPLAVVTLLSQDVAREALARNGLAIDVVVGRDPVVRPKPAADGVMRALELLGASAADAVMVGDSTWDAQAAAASGVRFVGVHSGKAEFAAAYPRVPVCGSLADVLFHLG